MVFQTINKKLLELGPSLGFLYKKNLYFKVKICIGLRSRQIEPAASI